MDGPWFFYLILAAIPGAIVGGAAWLQLQALQMARWPRAPGRVVVSTTEMLRVATGGPSARDSEPRDFAKIVYEYTVAGQTYRSDRVGLGVDSGDFEVAERIARYPVGRPVTVFYNPSKRSDAVLEREIPAFVWKGLALFVAIYAAIVFGSIVGFRKLADTLAAVVGNPTKAPFVAACIAFALFAGLIIYAIQRHAARTRRWPTVPGRVQSAEVRSFQKLERSGSRRRWVTRYRPEVIYGYEVGGVRYTGTEVGTTVRVSSNLKELTAPSGGYAPGRDVRVHYNPENPTESILDPSAGLLWLLWFFPAGLLALAYLVGR